MPDDPKPSAPPSDESLVCGRKMTTAPENFYPAEYQGRVIYFCTHFCLETFNADPERFYAAHSRSKDTPK
jgi:YHS domain-containing protein